MTSANVTFALNTNPTDWASAEKSCNDMGGHLAYYSSLAEQVSHAALNARALLQQHTVARASGGERAAATCLPPGAQIQALKGSATLPRCAQTEVETYYITNGLFYPSFMPAYWLGLKVEPAAWPRFQWISNSIPVPGPQTYEHWGLSESYREPDNRGGNEYCGVANYSQAYSNAWGWADSNCTMTLPFICRQDGGCLGLGVL